MARDHHRLKKYQVLTTHCEGKQWIIIIRPTWLCTIIIHVVFKTNEVISSIWRYIILLEKYKIQKNHTNGVGAREFFPSRVCLVFLRLYYIITELLNVRFSIAKCSLNVCSTTLYTSHLQPNIVTFVSRQLSFY